MPEYQEFFRRSLHRLRDFRLYLSNPTFANPPWERSGPRVLILRLSRFADVERSTPHLFLFREVRQSLAGSYIDMAFPPCDTDLRFLEENDVPPLIGTQSHRPLSDFDLVLVSNSHLLELMNLPILLQKCGVPLWASERGKEWPAVILGGSNSTAAHAIVRETGDCMADAIFFGEGEGSVGRIAAMYGSLPMLPKLERLCRISEKVTGLWPAGDLAGKIRKAVSLAESATDQTLPAPILPGSEAGTARLTITRGCPCLCSFCFEGHDRKPFREIPASDLLAAARELKAGTGADTLEIESFNFNTHSEIAALLAGLNRIFLRVNLMSQRADILARSPSLLDLELAADKRSFTLGIEGISDRLRRFLRKSLDTEDIKACLEAIHERRVREVKLFYLLTGREREKDFLEFSGFLRWLKETRRTSEAAPRLIFSFGLLVRMPFTPLRHDEPLLDRRAAETLINRAKSICETGGFEFRLAMSWSDYAATQGLALENRDAPAFAFLEDESSRTLLFNRYLDAKAGRDDGYCRKGKAECEVSQDCQECERCTMRSRPPRCSPRHASNVRELASLMREKHGLKPLFARWRVPRHAAGFGREWLDSWMLREFLSANPDQGENVLAIRESLVNAWLKNAHVAWFGRTVVAITAWDSTGINRRLTELDAWQDETDAEGRAEPGQSDGHFTRLTLRIELPAPFFPDPVARLADFLRDLHAPVTVKRSAGGIDLVAAARTLKKKIVFAGRCATMNEGFQLDLEVGPKFPLGEFLGSFPDPDAGRRAMVEVISVN